MFEVLVTEILAEPDGPAAALLVFAAPTVDDLPAVLLALPNVASSSEDVSDISMIVARVLVLLLGLPLLRARSVLEGLPLELWFEAVEGGIVTWK